MAAPKQRVQYCKEHRDLSVCCLGEPVPAPPKGSITQVPQKSWLPVSGLPSSSSLHQGLQFLIDDCLGD